MHTHVSTEDNAASMRTIKVLVRGYYEQIIGKVDTPTNLRMLQINSIPVRDNRQVHEIPYIAGLLRKRNGLSAASKTLLYKIARTRYPTT